MTENVLQGGALALQLSRIDQLLSASQPLWRAPAFNSSAINTAHKRTFSASSLLEAITALDIEALEEIDADPRQLFALVAAPIDSIVPGYAAVHHDLEAFLLPPLDDASMSEIAMPFWLETGIGGRKLDQIKRFIRQVPSLSGDVLEWCAGKGHLGRLWLHYHNVQGGAQAQVHSLEWQAKLCLQGTQLATQHEVAQTFYRQDVLLPLQWSDIGAPRHALALHACGDLHRALLQQAVREDIHTLIVAPCCYHLTGDAVYRPLSQRLATNSELLLPKSALKLAVQGQVTGGRRITKLRYTEVQWRLAYQIARECTTELAYKQLPALPKALLSEDFNSFFSWACAQHDWQPQGRFDCELWLSQAAGIQLKLKQLDIVRHSFRRLLEFWLVLDRAVFLQEHGYEVTVKVFCPYTTSPRNLLISAHKKCQPPQ